MEKTKKKPLDLAIPLQSSAMPAPKVQQPATPPLDLAEVRARLAGRSGREYWRSLDELAATPDFQEYLHREFPRQASEWVDPDPVSRRTFLKLMGASLALAGLSGCSLTNPQEKIVPYVNKPEQVIPGIALFYATAMTLGGYATGLLVRSNEGRPTKVEGNPDHPASLGATDVYAQASILSMYDPDRSQQVTKDGQASKWEDFVTALTTQLGSQAGGAGLRILTETTTSPTLVAQMQTLLQALPQARWVQYDESGANNGRVGAQLAFGQPVNTVYDFTKAKVVLSLDANFLQTPAGRVRYSRDFTSGRLVREGQKEINRLYVVESTLSITGAIADHRLPLRASKIDAFARALAQAVGVAGVTGTAPAGVPADWLPALAADLQANRGTSVVIAGDDQPPAVHALAHAINAVLGNVGQTVLYTQSPEANPTDQLAALRDLAGEMNAGTVKTLLVVGANPAYTAPADIDFAAAMAKVPFRAHLGLYADETSAASQWYIPEAHFLETWSDARAYDGSVSIIQPLIAPMYGGKTVHELIAAAAGQNSSSFDLVRAYWQQQQGDAAAAPAPTPLNNGAQGQRSAVVPNTPFEQFWAKALNKGVIDGTALPAATATLAAAATAAPAAPADDQGLEITFRLDPSLWDGRFANNGWLQELPKPLTTITWDNVAMVSPTYAQQQGLQNGDVVELSYQNRTVQAPIWIQPGQPDDSVSVTLGYGRSKVGQTGAGVGFNAYGLRTLAAPGFGGNLGLRKVGSGHLIAATQQHFAMEGRGLVQHATLEEYIAHPGFVHESAEAAPTEGGAAEGGAEHHPSLFPDFPYNGNKWGMVIDTQACIGCNSCVIACQSENNIPVVGKDQVANTREMHWLKIDQYFEGSLENPQTFFQPRLCMHCENAPCEVVCPVAATSHDHEGLNQMVYNRCVGTRYCANNCPYKVRRFNFFQYSKNDVPVIELMYNPQVTVRNRGVMEKCSYCVQRIAAARIDSDRENRPIADGEVVTACQQSCPTNAIVFGNLNDANSQVAKLKAREINYGLLEELNTKPRTSYMPRVRNPNPAIKEASDGV